MPALPKYVAVALGLAFTTQGGDGFALPIAGTRPKTMTQIDQTQSSTHVSLVLKHEA